MSQRLFKADVDDRRWWQDLNFGLDGTVTLICLMALLLGFVLVSLNVLNIVRNLLR